MEPSQADSAEIGSRLRELRLGRGLTLAAAAAQAGLSPAALGNW